MLLRRNNDELFRSIAVQRGALAAWFEDNLGWQLQVDVRAGIARLHKRTQDPDPHRGLRRTRSSKRPFNPLRYQLVSLICAELLRRSHTTLGELGDAIARICASDAILRSIDLARHADRVAFVDALLWLIDAGAVDVTAGAIDGFDGSQGVDAVLVADTTLIPLLLSSETPPSRIEAETPAQWIEALSREPRYGTAVTDYPHTDRGQRARWARHRAIRGLLDEPALDLDTLHSGVREYLFTPAGRDKVLAAAQGAGLTVERHADVWLAIDPSRESTDKTFSTGGRASTVEQAAAILLSFLVGVAPDGKRQPLRRSVAALRQALREHLERHPGWARTFRGGDGVEALLSEALDLLETFDLVRRAGEPGPGRPPGAEDTVVPRPAAGRYAVSVKTAPSASSQRQETSR